MDVAVLPGSTVCDSNSQQGSYLIDAILFVFIR